MFPPAGLKELSLYHYIITNIQNASVNLELHVLSVTASEIPNQSPNPPANTEINKP